MVSYDGMDSWVIGKPFFGELNEVCEGLYYNPKLTYSPVLLLPATTWPPIAAKEPCLFTFVAFYDTLRPLLAVPLFCPMFIFY